MFCTQCGKKLRENANFCTQCGTRVRKTQTTGNNRFSSTSSNLRRSSTDISSRRTLTTYNAEKTISSSGNISPTETRGISDFKTEKTNNFEPRSSKSLDNSRVEAKVEIFQPRETEKVEKIPKEKESVLDNIPTEKVEKSDQIKPKNEVLDVSKPDLAKQGDDDQNLKQLKEQLLKIKYSFKKIDELNPNSFRTTFIAGSIQQLDWQFMKDKMILKATLPDDVNEKIRFVLSLDESRPDYDWKDPFAHAKLETNINESLVRKIRREGRVVEKLARIIGAVKATVSEKIVTLEIKSNNPDNVRSGLDAVKEIAWLMDITLK